MSSTIKKIKQHKENLAIVFSSLALLLSFGKEVFDVLVPKTQMTLIVRQSRPSDDDDDDDKRFVISSSDQKLRLDPNIDLSFVNNSGHFVLVNQVTLVTPKIETGSDMRSYNCKAEISFEMWMTKFLQPNGEKGPATQFSVAPGEITSLRIYFMGNPDISKWLSNKVLPICIYTELYDSQGRRREFYVPAFNLIEMKPGEPKYDNLLPNSGLAILRYSQLWSIIN